MLSLERLDNLALSVLDGTALNDTVGVACIDVAMLDNELAYQEWRERGKLEELSDVFPRYVAVRKFLEKLSIYAHAIKFGADVPATVRGNFLAQCIILTTR